MCQATRMLQGLRQTNECHFTHLRLVTFPAAAPCTSVSHSEHAFRQTLVKEGCVLVAARSASPAAKHRLCLRYLRLAELTTLSLSF